MSFLAQIFSFTYSSCFLWQEALSLRQASVLTPLDDSIQIACNDSNPELSVPEKQGVYRYPLASVLNIC